MKRLLIDIETNLKHDTIWCAVTQDIDTGEVIVHTTPQRLKSVIKSYDIIVGHNIIGFDAPVLREVWGISIRTTQVQDTLVMSRLYNPILEGGHSLKNWGKILGNDKINFDAEDFDGGLTDDMIKYCKQDVALNVEVYKTLLKQLSTWGDYEKALQLEHEVAIHITRQERNGFNFDLEKATVLQAEVADRMAAITDELQAVFPPIVEERWSEKTGKRLKDKVTRFNVGSRKQIGDRLQSLGWQPTEFTDSGQPKIDETILRDVDIPQAKPIAEYLTLQKVDGFLSSWIKNVCSDGKIRGRVISCGAVTNRMTHHSPNLGQVPSTKSMYGAECRSLFIANEGEVMVGADLSGIELRCLAHYMRDKKYTEQILDGDIHTYNQKAAGLPTRDNAKTFIYAFLYGAGAEKLGQIIGKGSQAGGRLKSKFMKSVPSLAKLIDKVQRLSRKGNVPALDGRRIQVKSEHSALNMLLQSAGAIVAKQWIVEVHKLMRQNNIKFTQVAMVHDEIQASVPPEQAELAGELMVKAAKLAGETLGFRMPVDAEYSVGKSWLETH
jgi:DNA polymerase-1